MRTLTEILHYFVGALIVLIMGGLAGWYFYLRSQEAGLTSADIQTNIAQSLPFGSNSDANTVGTQNVSSSLTSPIETPGSATSNTVKPTTLWAIDKSPVAGLGFITFGGKEKILFAERANGYVFSADPESGMIIRYSNTLRPKIYEAFFAKGGSVIERSLDDTGFITTYAGVLASTTPVSTSTTSPDSLRGIYLATSMQSLSLNSETRALAFSTVSSDGASIMMQDWSGKPKQIFTSIVASWRIQSLPDGRIVLTSAPSDGVPGYAYTVNQAALTTLISNVPGLTIVPKSGSSALLYSSANSNDLSVYVQTKPSDAPTKLSIRTIADKCVWYPGASLIAYCAVPASIPRGSYLTDWYQGSVHTADAWWKIDVMDGTTQLVYSPPMALDVENPTIDSTGSFIAFMDAKDKSLWMLRIPQ